MLKPRSQAAAIGIRKVHSSEELWQIIDALGDARAEYLLEQFVPGDVFHVDSIVFDDRVRFAVASRYRMPPMAVAHEGGIFVTRTLTSADPVSPALKELNARVLKSFRLLRGASHTEFIRAQDGAWQFLETSARVGGAFIVDVVEAATGINLWREWAHVEIAGQDGTYDPPAVRELCGGIVLSLARQDTRPRRVHRSGDRHSGAEAAPRRFDRHFAERGPSRPAAGGLHAAVLRRFPRLRPAARKSHGLTI